MPAVWFRRCLLLWLVMIVMIMAHKIAGDAGLEVAGSLVCGIGFGRSLNQRSR